MSGLDLTSNIELHKPRNVSSGKAIDQTGDGLGSGTLV